MKNMCEAAEEKWRKCCAKMANEIGANYKREQIHNNEISIDRTIIRSSDKINKSI